MDGVELSKDSKRMGRCVIDDTHRTHKCNMRHSSSHLEFIKLLSGLRVEDSIEYPHKSYC
jgi:hypothetical protein